MAPAPRDQEQRIPLGHCNKLVILRSHERVTGSWIVNPSLSIPTALVADSIPSRFAASNLWLESTEEGVNATVRVVDDPPPPGDRVRTELVFSGRGAVTVRVHSLGNLPSKITAVSFSDDVDIRIPADFVGVVTTQCTSTRPTMPSQRCRPLSEIDGKGRYFIGEDWSAAADHDGWHGNTLDIKAHVGRIHVGFVSLESSLIYRIKSSEGYAVVSRIIAKGAPVAVIGILMLIAFRPTIVLCVLWISWQFF